MKLYDDDDGNDNDELDRMNPGLYICLSWSQTNSAQKDVLYILQMDWAWLLIAKSTLEYFTSWTETSLGPTQPIPWTPHFACLSHYCLSRFLINSGIQYDPQNTRIRWKVLTFDEHHVNIWSISTPYLDSCASLNPLSVWWCQDIGSSNEDHKNQWALSIFKT